jgi:hypothetical protein
VKVKEIPELFNSVAISRSLVRQNESFSISFRHGNFCIGLNFLSGEAVSEKAPKGRTVGALLPNEHAQRVKDRL